MKFLTTILLYLGSTFLGFVGDVNASTLTSITTPISSVDDPWSVCGSGATCVSGDWSDVRQILSQLGTWSYLDFPDSTSGVWFSGQTYTDNQQVLNDSSFSTTVNGETGIGISQGDNVTFDDVKVSGFTWYPEENLMDLQTDTYQDIDEDSWLSVSPWDCGPLNGQSGLCAGSITTTTAYSDLFLGGTWTDTQIVNGQVMPTTSGMFDSNFWSGSSTSYNSWGAQPIDFSDPVPTPEPGTFVLAGLALAAFGLAKKKTRV